MKRHMFWKQRYHALRYMEHLSDTDLQQRAKDILSNITYLSTGSKIALQDPKTCEGEAWLIAFTHLQEEFSIRYGPYPKGFESSFVKDALIPNPTTQKAKRAIEVVSGKNVHNGYYLFKYGNVEYLREILEKGKIRLGPASSYNDSSFSPAVRDNELEKEIELHPERVKITIQKAERAIPGSTIKPVGNLKCKQTSETDYYVYCLSSSYAYRSFDDFDYDGCLWIKKPDEFVAMCLSVLKKELPGWHCAASPVRYLDPLNSYLHMLDVFFVKHFRHAFEKEYRITAIPNRKMQKLESRFIKIGCLKDISELIAL